MRFAAGLTPGFGPPRRQTMTGSPLAVRRKAEHAERIRPPGAGSDFRQLPCRCRSKATPLRLRPCGNPTAAIPP